MSDQSAGINIDAPAPPAVGPMPPDTDTSTPPAQPIQAVQPAAPQAPSIAANIATARAQGFSWDEINNSLADKRAQANAQGFTDAEFNAALGLPQPPAGQTYFSLGDIAKNSARAFIDYPEGAWEALKADWKRQHDDMMHQPDGFWDAVKTRWDEQIAAGKIPIDIFNMAVSPLAAVWGAAVARPLSAAETNLSAMVKNALENKITDPAELKLWQQQGENDLNTALLALGPEGGELSLAARAKAAPIIASKDTLDAATAVVGSADPAVVQKNLGTVANNLHDNWVKTGEPPLDAARRAQSDPDFRAQLHTPPVETPAMSILPETKEPVLDPKPVEEGQKINPEFASEKPETPTLVEPVSPELGAKIAGPDAVEPVNNLADFKNILIDDPIKASGIAARYIRDTFVPTAAGPEAAEAALVNRKATGEANRATAITQASLNTLWRKAGNLVAEDKDNFIDYMQGRSAGAKIDPALQETADTLRGIFQDREAQLKELPAYAQREFQRDYFPQNWKETPALRARWDAMTSRQGSTGFLKEKVIPTHAEGRALGYEDRYDHPLETVMNNIRNADRVIGHSNALEEMQQRGLADRFTGEKDDPIPAGWVRLEGGLAGDNGEGALYAQANAARIYNNSISKGFTGAQGEIFKAVNSTSNFLRQLKLGLFNIYHSGTTLISSMIRESGLGVGELAESVNKVKEGDLLGASKNVAGGVARIVTSPMAPIKHFIEGMKGLKEYKLPGVGDPQTQKLIDLLTKSNSITSKMPEYMSEGTYQNMWDAWKRGDYDNFGQKAADFLNSLTYKNLPIKVPALAFKTIGQFAAATMKPIFDGLVPRIKTGASMEAMGQWLEDHPNATYDQQLKAAGQIGDSMDNLFGEMMRDNLFWKKQLEQGVNLGFLSYGWVMGELRGTLGGLKDIATLQNTSNAQNVIGFVLMMPVINSVYQYLHTGQWPQTLEDLYAPRTGGTQRAGGQFVPERAVLPGHTSQLAHYKDDFFHELFGSEANPLFGMVGLLTTGKNSAGYDAYNRNGDFFEKSREFTKAIIDEAEPITLATMELGAKKGSAIGPVERFAGIRQSPQFVANPEGVERQARARQSRAWGEAQKFQDRQNKSYENPE